MRLFHCSALITITLLCAVCICAQSPTCTLKQAPELHGFRLGMTALEVRSNLTDPTAFESKAPSGTSTGPRAMRISGSELKPVNAEGVDDLNLTFADNKLAVIKVTYNGAVKWDGAQDFFARVSEKLGLPLPAASTSAGRGGGGNEKQRTECAGFAVTLAYSFGVSPSVIVSDTVAQKSLDRRREKQEEEDAKEIRITPSSRPRRP